MAKKNLKQDEDTLHHKTKKVVKLLEVTKENINAVLLELRKDEGLRKLNIRNIVNYIFSNYKDKGEILSKLKVLKNYEEVDVEDSIMKILLDQLGYDVGDMKRSIVRLSGEMYPLSRRISLWYFRNKELEEDVDYYLEELERIIFKTGRVNFITEEESSSSDDCSNVDESNNDCGDDSNADEDSNECSKDVPDKDINHRDSVDQNVTNHSVIELKELTDSEEMDRLDNALGILFKDKQPPLTTSDKQRIAKVLDLLEAILEKNPVHRLIHFKRLVGLVDIDDVLFKKVFRVLKHLTKKYPDEHLDHLYAFYVDALHKYRNISRTIDTMQEYFRGVFKWEDVLQASSENEMLDLSLVDRSKINKEEFYSYCFSKQVYLWKIQGILLYFVRKEEDPLVLLKLKELVNRIEFSDEKMGVIESINEKMKAIGGN